MNSTEVFGSKQYHSFLLLPLGRAINTSLSATSQLAHVWPIAPVSSSLVAVRIFPRAPPIPIAHVARARRIIPRETNNAADAQITYVFASYAAAFLDSALIAECFRGVATPQPPPPPPPPPPDPPLVTVCCLKWK